MGLGLGLELEARELLRVESLLAQHGAAHVGGAADEPERAEPVRVDAARRVVARRGAEQLHR